MDEAAKKKYIDFIRSLPNKDKFEKEDLLVDGLLMGCENNLKMYYAPFDYVNRDARVIIIGITPGFTQMEEAIRYFKEQKALGKTDEYILENVKKKASFAGTMRTNLIDMLDKLNVNGLLNIGSCKTLFEDTNFELLHSTSLIKYPVFNNGENYRGSSPKILSSNLLKKYVTEEFLTELDDIKKYSLIIPLGKAVSDVLNKLLDNNIKNKCLFDFPHPSNGLGWPERLEKFNAKKEELLKRVENIMKK